MNRIAKTLCSCLTGVLMLATASPARAEESAKPSKEIQPVQISVFAQMVKAPEADVAVRLAADPRLRGLALRAVEARAERKSSAKSRAITGFVILGVGDIAGTAIMLSTPVPPPGESADASRAILGLGVVLAATAVGLAVAIPGLVSMGRQGPDELQAIAEYRQQQPLPTPAPTRPSPTTAQRLSMPLLSFTF
jgi:hypothetical protein